MTDGGVSYQTSIEGGKHWSFTARAGTLLRMVDGAGGANVGMLFYNPANTLERYNAPDTLKCQHTFKLTKGHCLYSDMGRIFCSIVEDTHGWHDTVCGNSTRALVAERWGERSYQAYRNEWTQNGHDAFLVEAGKYGMGRRDLAANVNWFSKVSADEDGTLLFDPVEGRRCLRRAAFRDGHAGAAAYLSASVEQGAGVSQKKPVAPLRQGAARRAGRFLHEFTPGEYPRLRQH